MCTHPTVDFQSSLGFPQCLIQLKYCISYISIAVIKSHEQNLLKTERIAWLSRHIESSTSGAPWVGGRNRRLNDLDHISSILRKQTDEKEVRWGYRLSEPTPSEVLPSNTVPPKCFITSRKQHHQLRAKYLNTGADRKHFSHKPPQRLCKELL